MKKRKNFFEVTEEDNAKVVGLIKKAILVGMSVAFLGALWVQYKYKVRAAKQKRKFEIRTALREDALDKFINNPTLFDTYTLQGTIKESGKPIDISTTTNSIDIPNLLFGFHIQGNYLGIKNITLDQLNALRKTDTIEVSLGKVQLMISGIKSYERNDGPNFKPYSVGRGNITLRKSGGKATILSIENIRGTAQTKAGLPLELSDDKITFDVTRDGEVAEFRLIGKSDQSDQWSRRVVIHGWNAYIFPQ